VLGKEPVGQGESEPAIAKVGMNREIGAITYPVLLAGHDEALGKRGLHRDRSVAGLHKQNIRSVVVGFVGIDSPFAAESFKALTGEQTVVEGKDFVAMRPAIFRGFAIERIRVVFPVPLPDQALCQPMMMNRANEVEDAHAIIGAVSDDTKLIRHLSSQVSEICYHDGCGTPSWVPQSFWEHSERCEITETNPPST